MQSKSSADKLTGAVENPGPHYGSQEGTGENMDVTRFLNATAVLILTTGLNIACSSSKTAESTFPYSSAEGGATCHSQSLIKTKFIVTYEDGRMEVIRAENAELFKKNFLEPKLQEIKHVEFDRLIRLDDPRAPEVTTEATDDWGPLMISAKSAWDQGITGQGVKVAVVDAAVDYSHPQIGPRLDPNFAEINGSTGADDDGNGLVDDKYGWDFYGHQPQPVLTAPAPGQEMNIHGTHVAGIIVGDHSTGDVSGTAPGATLIPVNFMDADGGGSMSDAIFGIRYAAARGAKVINASWGGGSCSETLWQTIVDVTTNGNNGKGLLFVAAAGNEGVDFDRSGSLYYTYPAVFALPNQLTIAASDITDSLASFSNKSYNWVHLAAPGKTIRSTAPKMFYPSGSTALSGTSMAAPFVSGAAALLWSVKPEATAAQVKQALMHSTDYKSMKVVTQGRLNIQRAIDEIRRTVP